MQQFNYKYINLPNANGVPCRVLFSTTIVKTGARSILRSYFPLTPKQACPKS